MERPECLDILVERANRLLYPSGPVKEVRYPGPGRQYSSRRKEISTNKKVTFILFEVEFGE